MRTLRQDRKLREGERKRKVRWTERRSATRRKEEAEREEA